MTKRTTQHNNTTQQQIQHVINSLNDVQIQMELQNNWSHQSMLQTIYYVIRPIGGTIINK